MAPAWSLDSGRETRLQLGAAALRLGAAASTSCRGFNSEPRLRNRGSCAEPRFYLEAEALAQSRRSEAATSAWRLGSGWEPRFRPGATALAGSRGSGSKPRLRLGAAAPAFSCGSDARLLTGAAAPVRRRGSGSEPWAPNWSLDYEPESGLRQGRSHGGDGGSLPPPQKKYQKNHELAKSSRINNTDTVTLGFSNLVTFL